MSQLSPRLQNLEPSATLAMTAKARELKAAGKDIISLSIGEPDFNTPDFIKDAAITAINENYNSYTPIGGYPELKKAVCQKFKRDNGLDYTTDQIVVSTGAKQSLYNLFQALLSEGDEILVPAPYWVSYKDMAGLAGASVKIIKTSIDTDFKITAEQLKNNISDKTKAIIFSSPCNPSGSVYSGEELKSLAEVLKNHKHITIISDEIYEHINYGVEHVSMASIAEVYDQTVTVNGLSKAFAMTGWRLGYIGAPQWIAKAVDTIQGQSTSGTNCIAQRAAITALEADPSALDYMVDAFAKRREMVIALAKDINGFEVNEPKGAFYIFPRVSGLFGKTFNGYSINSAGDLAIYLLEHAGVATVQGDAFGDADCLRISYAASEEVLKEAFARIKKALS